MSPESSPIRRPGVRCATLLTVALAASGCASGFERLDRDVDRLIAGASSSMNARAPESASIEATRTVGNDPPPVDIASKTLPTTNPRASQLPFTPMDEAAGVIRRLADYNQLPADAMQLDLFGTLIYSRRHSRDYTFEEERYVLAALSVLAQRHLFGPRFFNDTSVLVTGDGDDGLFDTSLDLINDLGVTQRLENGGVVTARVVAAATEDLHQRVAGENVQSADILLTAEIPILRGSGTVASESLIQAERSLIYAARDYERFTREFLFEITTLYLDLIVQQQAIVNAELQVGSLEALQDRERTLYEAGRITRYESALAEQRTAFAVDGLNNQLEQYRLAVDRFKVRIGMPTETPLIILATDLDLPAPSIDLEQAVRLAFDLRLDLQTRRDQLQDTRRQIENARNDLLPDLDLLASVDIPTDPGKNRAGLDFSPEDTSFQAGFTFSLPLDRVIERIAVRDAQIQYDRAIRGYDEFRDIVAVNVRAAVREIDRSLFSLEIQEQNVMVAEERLASVNAQPDRVDSRDSSDAVDALAAAQDDLDAAARDHQVAILGYLLATGQLRVDERGFVAPLAGMDLARGTPVTGDDAVARTANPAPEPPRTRQGAGNEPVGDDATR